MTGLRLLLISRIELWPWESYSSDNGSTNQYLDVVDLLNALTPSGPTLRTPLQTIVLEFEISFEGIVDFVSAHPLSKLEEALLNLRTRRGLKHVIVAAQKAAGYLADHALDAEEWDTMVNMRLPRVAASDIELQAVVR